MSQQDYFIQFARELGACWQDAPDGTRFLRQEVYDATGGLVRATCRAVRGPSADAAKKKED